MTRDGSATAAEAEGSPTGDGLEGRVRWLGLTRTAVAVVAFAVVVVLVLSAGLAWRERVRAFREAELLAGTLATVLAEHAGRLFETADLVYARVVDFTGSEPDAPIPRDLAAHRELVRLVRSAPYLTSIWVGDAQGHAVLTSRQHPAPDLNAADRDYFRVPRDHPRATFVGLLPDNRYRDDVLITVSRRLEPVEGPFRGFVTITLSPDYIRSLYARLDIGYDTVLYLLDAELQPLLREPRLPVERLAALPTAQRFAPAAAAEAGLIRAEGLVGEGGRIYAFHRVPEQGAHVVVGIATADVAASWRKRALVYLWSGLAGVLGVLGLGWVGVQHARREEAITRALEARVRERTAALEKATAQLEEALAHKEVLLREVNHRVKNSLQLVASLLGLQERGEANPRVAASLAEARGRVATVARVHEQLHRGDQGERVAFAAYLRRLCDDLAASLPAGAGDREIVVEGEETELPIDMATPLALIVNELVTNACKYAYPAEVRGTVWVRFAVRAGTLRLEVEDRGGGLPAGFDPTRTTSLGMRIVAALVRQLHGAWHAEPAEPGTRFVVATPIP